MVLFARRLVASLGAIGLIGGVWVYAASFAGLTTGSVIDAHPWLFIFFGGILLLYVPVAVIEYDGPSWERKFFWKGFAKARPTWAVSVIKVMILFAFIHFVLFLLLTHGCSPEIVNGSFVLNDHRTVRRVLSQNEYLSLKGWETRFFASFMIMFYTLITLYWSFRRLADSRIHTKSRKLFNRPAPQGSEERSLQRLGLARTSDRPTNTISCLGSRRGMAFPPAFV